MVEYMIQAMGYTTFREFVAMNISRDVESPGNIQLVVKRGDTEILLDGKLFISADDLNARVQISGTTNKTSFVMYDIMRGVGHGTNGSMGRNPKCNAIRESERDAKCKYVIGYVTLRK